MPKGVKQSIIYEGVEYASWSEAARANGVSYQTIQYRMREKSLLKSAQPRIIEGMQFDTNRDAAIKIGVTIEEIRIYLRVRRMAQEVKVRQREMLC